MAFRRNMWFKRVSPASKEDKYLNVPWREYAFQDLETTPI